MKAGEDRWAFAGGGADDTAAADESLSYLVQLHAHQERKKQSRLHTCPFFCRSKLFSSRRTSMSPLQVYVHLNSAHFHGRASRHRGFLLFENSGVSLLVQGKRKQVEQKKRAAARSLSSVWITILCSPLFLSLLDI